MFWLTWAQRRARTTRLWYRIFIFRKQQSLLSKRTYKRLPCDSGPAFIFTCGVTIIMDNTHRSPSALPSIIQRGTSGLPNLIITIIISKYDTWLRKKYSYRHGTQRPLSSDRGNRKKHEWEEKQWRWSKRKRAKAFVANRSLLPTFVFTFQLSHWRL